MTDHGLEYLAEAQKYFAKEGIVIDGSYPMDSGDAAANSQLIAAAKAADSDILCAFAYPEHVFATAAPQSYDNRSGRQLRRLLSPIHSWGRCQWSDGVRQWATIRRP